MLTPTRRWLAGLAGFAALAGCSSPTDAPADAPRPVDPPTAVQVAFAVAAEVKAPPAPGADTVAKLAAAHRLPDGLLTVTSGGGIEVAVMVGDLVDTACLTWGADGVGLVARRLCAVTAENPHIANPETAPALPAGWPPAADMSAVDAAFGIDEAILRAAFSADGTVTDAHVAKGIDAAPDGVVAKLIEDRVEVRVGDAAACLTPPTALLSGPVSMGRCPAA